MSAIIYNAIILWNCFANLKQIAPKTVESTVKQRRCPQTGKLHASCQIPIRPSSS